ncbi:MAG: radical SAM protein [Candidatus Accumulibacter phosphatis]|uniref:B12-binding domain-containing radical SAM protein n=1 Tax=Candidatus Accumulibacter contiguus TaxID=2954381 RepID=UPI002FC2AB63
MREQLFNELGVDSDDLRQLLLFAACYHSLTSQNRRDPVPAGTRRWVLDRLIVVNQQSPGHGVTPLQAAELASDEDFLDKLDLLPGMGRQVRANASYFIAERRANGFRRTIGPDDGLVRDALADILAKEFPITPTSIEFVTFGSPWHYALWNNLSVETLTGDLLGEYGDEVAITVRRLDRLDLVDRAFNRERAAFPAIVGLSVELGTLQLVDRYLDLYSQDPRAQGSILVLGNQLPTYFPERFLNDLRIPTAIVCLHEGELVMRGLVEFIRGRTQLQYINNIVYRCNETRAIHRTPLVNLDLTALPHPPSADTVKPGITNMIQTSRGCVFSCTYCTRWRSFNASTKIDAIGDVTTPSPSTKWRHFSLERVFQNVEMFVSRGIREIEFCDDEFFGGRSVTALNRIHDFALGMASIAQKWDTQVSFRIFTTPLIISREPRTQKIAEENRRIRYALQLLRNAGLTRVYIGLESGSWAQKLRYNRKETIDDTLCALKVLQELDLDIDVGFIMFDPNLTIEELLENIAFFRANGLVRYNTWPFRPLVVNEGTAIKQTLDSQGLLTGEQDPNFMSSRYRFADPPVAQLAEAVHRISRSSAPVFYALKTISKSHWHGGDEAVDFATQTVQANAEIYLDMMESLGEAAVIGGMDDQLGQICTQAEREVRDLVNQVSQMIARGVFRKRSEDEAILLRHIEAYSRELDRQHLPVE